MSRRPSRHLAAVLTALALSAAGLATTAPAHADLLCPDQVKVASAAGDFCVTATPNGVTVKASGDTTVTNNMPVPVTATADTGATATVAPGARAQIRAGRGGRGDIDIDIDIER